MRQTQKIPLDFFKIILCLLFVSGSFSPAITNATEYFVAKDGNDAQPGTKSAPFLSIKKGMTTMSAGDKLYLRTGIYEETINSRHFTIPTGTSWGNAPVIAAYPGEMVTLKPSGAWEIINLSHSYIQYVIFEGVILDGINLNTEHGMGISLTGGANHVRFRNLEVKNVPINGVMLTPAPSEKISGISAGGTFNEFIGGKYHNAGWSPDLVGIGTETAYNFYIATNNNLIDGAEVYNATGYGFHIYNTVLPKPSHNIVRNCRIYNNSTQRASQAGILLGSGIGNMAYNNLVYDGRGHGIKVSNGAVDSLVYNNTIYDNDEAGVNIGNATNTVIKNNISYKNKSPYINQGFSTIESNNMMDGTDPGFVDPENLDWRLKSDANYKSPAIDAGLTLAEVIMDFQGNARPQGPKYDIGAFEFNQSTVGAPRNTRIVTVR